MLAAELWIYPEKAEGKIGKDMKEQEYPGCQPQWQKEDGCHEKWNHRAGCC